MSCRRATSIQLRQKLPTVGRHSPFNLQRELYKTGICTNSSVYINSLWTPPLPEILMRSSLSPYTPLGSKPFSGASQCKKLSSPPAALVKGGPLCAVRPGSAESVDDVQPSKTWIRAKRALRLQVEESRRPDALFQDGASEAFLEAGALTLDDQELLPTAPRTLEETEHALVTRYIDDMLKETVEDEALNVKQVVFLSSGAETRPYRLTWPPSTVFFEVAQGDPLLRLQALAKAAGVSIPRGRMLVRVEADWETGGEHWATQLKRRAYQGSRPSIWVMQGSSVASPEALVDLLMDIGDLAHVHTILVGTLATSALPSDDERSPEVVASRLFAEHGFSFEKIDRRKVANEYRVDSMNGEEFQEGQILFKAMQRRLSQAQVEALQPQIESMEEDRDGEESFEDLW